MRAARLIPLLGGSDETRCAFKSKTLMPRDVPLPSPAPLFHRKGLIWFWCLNDECDPAVMDRHIAAYAKAGKEVAAVCLHPRDGLLLPYGGDEWFEMIRRTCRELARHGIPIWLYDEDPYPSGAAGGRIVAEDPNAAARAIEMFQPDHELLPGQPFTFPMGNLLWCGLVDEKTGRTVDLTPRVGVIRRTWKSLDPWDSRSYYPATPRYSCPRAIAEKTEYGIRPPASVGGEMRLAAFVARPVKDRRWGLFHDTLNPRVTERFIELTHERYRQAVGGMFGKEIKAIFTDEPKFFASKPWTPGLFEAFQADCGYDLRPRLHHLFSDSLDHEACRTRIDYREWCGRRFEEAWVKPVAAWCRKNRLNLVGHISPEDDPIQQGDCVGNLFPLWRHFGLCGTDLIIPAVGDRRHTLISVGIVSAASAAAQFDKPGVLSETLACSGLDFTAKRAAPILRWQTVMGLTTPVIHYAQTSTKGMRLYDAPPDFGPESLRWEGMRKVARELAKVQTLLVGARQVAPVAILWPIRSFLARNTDWQDDETGMRRDFTELLRLCLDVQAGTHILDESVLWESRRDGAAIRVGRARYTHVLIPSCTVLHTRTIRALKSFHRTGLRVLLAGRAPERQHSDKGLAPADMEWCPRASPEEAAASLPRLIEIEGDATDIRCTAWEKGGRVARLLMNLRPVSVNAPVRCVVAGARVRTRRLRLGPGQITILR